MLLAVSTFAAEECELVSVRGRVVREISPHVYRPVPGAIVVIVRGFQTWTGITGGRGSFSVPVPMCGSFDITAVARGHYFEFQTFRLPVADQDGTNIDIVETHSCRPKPKK